jgi:hypothetical protein
VSANGDLFGGLVQGTLAEADWKRLEALLAADPAARREYREYLNLHVGLASYGAIPAAAEAPPRPRRSAAAWTAAAAGLLLAAAAFLRLPPDGAVLVRSSGAAWAADRPAPRPGAPLGTDEIALEWGFAEFRLARGVRLVAEGPVRMRLVGPGRLRLERGHVVAHVPPEGRGFVVETPPARVVDLGTEFGVGVREDGRTDVQVFRGKVTAERSGSGVVQDLDEGRALRIDAASGSVPVGIPFHPERFVRLFPTDDDGGQPAGPVYNVPRHETIGVDAATAVVDGDLSEWDLARGIRSACRPPYHESHVLEAALRYDERFLYVAARVADPAPLRSSVDRDADGRQAWRGGSVVLRLATDPSLGWPLPSLGPALADSKHPEYGRRPEDVNDRIAHLTFWYHRPSASPRLHLAYGMDFHGEQVDPQGWSGAFRVRPDGLGYSLEYAVPWSLLNAAARPPRAGDVFPCTWAAHWSDEEGMLSRGHLVEVANGDEVPYRFLRGTCWGKAVFRGAD